MNLARNGQGIQLEGPGMGRNLHSIPQIQTEIYEKTNGGKKWDTWNYYTGTVFGNLSVYHPKLIVIAITVVSRYNFVGVAVGQGQC